MSEGPEGFWRGLIAPVPGEGFPVLDDLALPIQLGSKARASVWSPVPLPMLGMPLLTAGDYIPASCHTATVLLP